jgi:hypothetical protein
MSSISLPPFGSLVPFATDKPLSDTSLPSAAVSLTLTSPSATVNVPDPADQTKSLGSFVLGGSASASVAIINSSSDPDPMGYFNLGSTATPAAQNPADAPLIEAPLVYDPGLAYVVLMGLSVTGKLSGNFTIGAVGTLGLDGSAELDASVCMAFPRGSMVQASLLATATNFKTVFSINELLALTAPGGTAGPLPWQVLSFGVQTCLSMSLKLTVSSLTSMVAASVASVLNQGGAFSFTANASATLTVTANATDGYRIFAQRAAAGGTQFSIKKTSSTSLGIDAGLGLTIGIADTALNSLVNSVFDQVAGVAAGTVQSILTSSATSVLTPAQQQDLHNLVTKLGLTSTLTSELQSLQARLASLKSDLTSRLTPTVSAQFTYSWQRLTSQSLVAQFTVSDVDLPKYHADILGLDLVQLMDDGIVFSRFMGKSTTEVDIGYGFSFGIGGYVFLKSWNSLKLAFTELDTIGSGNSMLRQFSFLGKRAYDLTWFGSTQEYYVELDASMPTPLPSPSAGDFQTGISVAFSWTNCTFGNILTAVADYGAVFKVFETDDVVAEAVSLTKAGVDPNATGNVIVNLTISDAVLKQILPTLTGSDYRGIIAPYAMARALPFNSSYPQRALVDTRMLVYAKLWANFLATEDLEDGTVAALCNQDLPGAGAPNTLVAAETGADVAWTVPQVAQMSSQEDLQDAINNQLPGCFSQLLARSGDFRRLFPSCVSDYDELAAQSYGSRILASMFIVTGIQNPVWLYRMARSVKFTWTVGGQTKTVVVNAGIQ